jgi:ElaB/YqjD/DUF883 family membrane-anchored ribosome-binding protein
MKCFKGNLLILIYLLSMVSPVKAVTAEYQEENSESSWWGASKQTMKQWWHQSSQIVSDLWSSSEPVSEPATVVAQIWQQVIPKVEEVLALEVENESLPESAWFGRDRQDNNSKINELLDEAVAILSKSDSMSTRDHIRALEKKIRALKQKIAQDHQAKMSAPIESKWETTVSDYENQIKQNQNLIKQYQDEIGQLKTQFAQQLSASGLYITRDQLEVLLSSVVGDDIIQSTVVYENIKQISQQLMTLTINSGEDLDISQRYYGMYMVLLKIVLHLQENIVYKIDNQYLPKIVHIMEEVQTLTATTQNLLRNEQDETRRRHLSANEQAQKLTLKTAELYQQHLIGQRSKVLIAVQKTMTDLQIAENTYKTVRVSGELVNLLRTSQKTFDLLLNLQIPDLLVFENLQMKQEFAILTQKISQE